MMVAVKALVEPVLLSLMDRLANPAYLTQIHWPERMSSQSRGFLIGNRKFTLMLTGRQALYSADSVFLVWLCAQKHFWM